jgi:hypothetical protein
METVEFKFVYALDLGDPERDLNNCGCARSIGIEPARRAVVSLR